MLKILNPGALEFEKKFGTLGSQNGGPYFHMTPVLGLLAVESAIVLESLSLYTYTYRITRGHASASHETCEN